MDYKSAGVNVEAGRAFVNRIKASVESTARPEVIGGIGGFGGFMSLPKGLKKPVLVSGTDGVGTKLELAQDYQSHYGVGIDLVAMCVNDVITSGAEPLFFLDYIATGKLGPEALVEVIEGISEGCKQSQCSLLGGETAEMPGFYADGQYDLAGFCVAVVEEEEIINGKEIRSGDQIIGIASSGLHSNGFSLIRKILSTSSITEKDCFGKEQTPLIDYLLRPTKLYVHLVKALLKEELIIKGMSHITGGGLPENLPRCLPTKLKANINRNSWELPSIYPWLSNKGDIPESDLWNTFNLGIGFCLVVSSDQAQAVVDFCFQNGCPAWNIGHIEEKAINSELGIVGLPL
ncbi:MULTISPECIES: phosphoribosylformylglycinamidine cyclo-ligase [unclassified Prochlorococcus]|uniref:phosphoribosylformylglycinamidine cyclo-ligase n=1 Tax=unclassified Prochlorococcus TaxID=2627481 RepID=UPI000533B664|nr:MULTISPECIES: phosphoribosylformylglycinamidine cyclo-ligase [unclassified Prochlorococcus]KGG14643.1 Phosphoribosylformylglycinamidine cyclo-ligase [Prochlorococcus sp. MIT 0602]KGG15928.1 Phosphoribosylformylglycinamidine cyclo-ligase [Prochlorococcus sp. MIT 0603]